MSSKKNKAEYIPQNLGFELIDTHTHLSDDAYPDGGEEAVRKALSAGVSMMILPGTRLGDLQGMKELAAKFPENIRMFAGLHPTELTDNPDEALATVRRELLTPGHCYVGVGEIGIDLYEEGADLDKQQRAFEQQCLMALEFDLPINIHCRDGLDQTLEVLKGLPRVPEGAFHCFGGSAEDVEKIRAVADFHFGINGIVTFKNSGLRETLPAIGLDRIVLETDAPYLAPAPYRGRLNDSSYLPLIVTSIADTLGVSVEEAARTTTATARRLYNLN